MAANLGMLIVLNTFSNEEKISLLRLINGVTMDQHAGCHLLYVKPDVPTCYFNIPSMVELVKNQNKEAKNSLRILGKQLLIPEEQQWIAAGKVYFEGSILAARLGINHIITSTAERQKMTRHFSHRRASNGCIFKTFKGLKSCSLSAVFSNEDMPLM